MRRNRGFTLIELLAVIIILTIIVTITIPIILGIINNARIETYKESLRNALTATTIYIASDKFEGITEEGISVTNANIQMKHKNFISGTITKNEQGKLKLDKVSNGIYCGSGTLENLDVVEGSCDLLDKTPPNLAIGSSSVTSNSATIVASAEDLESGIRGYQFSKDGGVTWSSEQTSNIYFFPGLTNNTEYTFKVKVYNNNKLESISDELIIKTVEIPIPTYSINTTDWSQIAIVTIDYPKREEGYVYEYSLDEGITWEEVVAPATTMDVFFISNGNIIARISDGTNIISGTTYEVINIDTTPPVITVDPLTVTINLGGIYDSAGVSATDDMLGDITSNIIVSGTLNRGEAGSYTLTYNVSDLAGNKAESKSRTITVNPITEYRYRTSSTSTSCSTCYDTCYRHRTGTANYSCSSGTLVGTSCVSSYNVYSTFHATYTCYNGTWTWSSHYCTGNCSAPCPDGSDTGGYEYSDTCPSGSCTSGSTTCKSYWRGSCSTSSPATVTYTCPSGYYGGGSSSTCTRSYSCDPYSCNCSTTTTWSSWSSWSTTPVVETSTRQVETRVITSINN